MWIVAVFDLPVETPAERKRYRALRRALAECGFCAVQKSLFWRWAEDRRAGDSLIRRVRRAPGVCGELLFFRISDRTFRRTLKFRDGRQEPLPEVPAPWIVVA